MPMTKTRGLIDNLVWEKIVNHLYKCDNTLKWFQMSRVLILYYSVPLSLGKFMLNITGSQKAFWTFKWIHDLIIIDMIPILILFAFDQQFKKSCMHCSIYFLFWPNVTQKLSCGPQSTRQEFFTDVADPVASHYKIIQSAHFFGHNFIHKV